MNFDSSLIHRQIFVANYPSIFFQENLKELHFSNDHLIKDFIKEL